MTDSSKPIYAALVKMFGKRNVDYAIAEAKGKAPCICRIKGANRCTRHPKKASR